MITINIARILLKKFLVAVGLRTKCCGARKEYHFSAWSYIYDGYRCSKCKSWV